MNLPWREIVGIIGPMLWDAATDPPDEYQGLKQTARGNGYMIRRIPGFVPKEFSITLWLPGRDTPTVFVRDWYFDDPDAMVRLCAHEGVHVDQWMTLGHEGFLRKYASHKGRRNMEAEGYSQNVIWRMANDTTEPAYPGMERLDYWMLHYAAMIDQKYHIRGSGIPAAYADLDDWTVYCSGLEPKAWSTVAKWKNEFR